MTRPRSEAKRKPSNPEPSEATEPSEADPETAVSVETPAAEQAADEQDEQAEDEPEQPTPDATSAKRGVFPPVLPNFSPRKPAPAKPDPGPRGRFGTISAQTRCANLQCPLGVIEAGFFVFSLARQWKVKRQHYLAGQCCCVRCAVDLHPMVAKRWMHFADDLAQSGVDPREIDRLTKGANSHRPRLARRQAAAIEARG